MAVLMVFTLAAMVDVVVRSCVPAQSRSSRDIRRYGVGGAAKWVAPDARDLQPTLRGRRGPEPRPEDQKTTRDGTACPLPAIFPPAAATWRAGANIGSLHFAS